MRRFTTTAAVLLLLCFLAACSTVNRGATLLPERAASGGFAVTALEGQGTFTPGWTVSEDRDGLLVTVTAQGAGDLSAAFLHVHYDSSRYTPDTVEIGGFLGAEGQVLSLALTDVDDVVPVGIVQIASANVSPREGEGLLARVRFKAGPFLAPRVTSKSAGGDYNAVDDLKSVKDMEAGTVTLTWTEKNLGDYNNDSLVGIQDLTPLGVYYGMWVSDTDDPLRAMLADGNNDGQITINDITQIGQNYGNMLSGYYLYTDATGTTRYGEGINALRADMLDLPINDDPNHPIKYQLEVDLPPSGQVEFTVAPVDETDLFNAGSVSNVALVRMEGAPPEPPTMFTAVSDEGTGHQTVELSWIASVSEFVMSYIIERQMDSEGLWSEVVEVPLLQTDYTDFDETFVEGESYSYRIYAKDDLNQFSDYAFSNSLVPYFIQPPDPPQNLVTSNNIPVANAIEVSWEPPADVSKVLRYHVYRKAPGETQFTHLAQTLTKDVTSVQDTGLTPDEYYEYYATSEGIEGGESEPSNTDGNTPSVYVDINVTNLTTDKTTHHNSGSEPASNLEVTTDVAPDSVDWDDGGAGVLTPNGTTATWVPTAGMDPVKVTVTCTVHLGPGEDTATLDLYVTDDAIVTQFGINGRYMTGAPCEEMLEKLIDGGDKIIGRQFEYYMTQDHVTWIGTFDTG